MAFKLQGTLLTLSALLAPAMVYAAVDSQTMLVADKLQIPGATLKSGSYTFSVEDRLADRAIVRIVNEAGDKHYLLLTVPNSKLTADSNSQLLYFGTSSDRKSALKAWKCATCAAPLEFVYPKLEAVKITDDSTEPVLAVDPVYDKLPNSLSADDMNVVTLWLFSPERITADNVGQGVKAAKYAPDTTPSSAASASADSQPAVASTSPTPVPEPNVNASPTRPVQTASVVPSTANDPATSSPGTERSRRHQLPKTASNTYTFLLCGLACFLSALVLRIRRASSAV